MNRQLERLHEYPFAKLNRLLADVQCESQKPVISLAVGEPQHSAPPFVRQALVDDLDRLNRYPSTSGELALREAIAAWLCRRYGIAGELIDAESHVLPVLGTREALFAIAQIVVDRPSGTSGLGAGEAPLVMLPSPFYQIYEGAAIMAGAQPVYLPCDRQNHFFPDLDKVTEQQWRSCQLIYVCSPGNPTGAVLSSEFYRQLLELADSYDFSIVSDECYSEIYLHEEEPPTGLLEVCKQLGRADFSRCLVFNSLSKRSNLAGLRSGFVAGDSALIAAFLQYRTYHGSAMPFHHQTASAAAWSDENHVRENRHLYRQKMNEVVPILQSCLELELPSAGFCLWAKTPINDELFTRELFSQQQVRVLPGSYLARTVNNVNPGENYIRMALVQSLETCIDAAKRIVDCVDTLVRR